MDALHSDEFSPSLEMSYHQRFEKEPSQPKQPSVDINVEFDLPVVGRHPILIKSKRRHRIYNEIHRFSRLKKLRRASSVSNSIVHELIIVDESIELYYSDQPTITGESASFVIPATVSEAPRLRNNMPCWKQMCPYQSPNKRVNQGQRK